MEAELLINFRSRSGRLAKAALLDALDREGIVLQRCHELTAGASLMRILGGIRKRRPVLLIVAGGDGTMSDIAGHLAGTGIEIGLVPLGTTNNFARSLNIPLQLPAAVRVIASQPAQPVDLGKLNDEYFTNVAGIGLSALIAHHVTNKAKRRWGRFAYAIVGIRQLITHKPFAVTLKDKDGELEFSFETHQVIIANGRYHAGKQIAIDAKVNNRELIIFGLGGPSKLNFLWRMLDFYLGKRKQIMHSSYIVGRDIVLRTSTPQRVELDGEVKYTTPLTATVRHGAILVRHPS